MADLSEPCCIGHLSIPVLDTKQFVEILPADSMVELRNSQHVLDGNGVPIFFAVWYYLIQYVFFPIANLFLLQNVVHISENLLGESAGSEGAGGGLPHISWPKI